LPVQELGESITGETNGDARHRQDMRRLAREVGMAGYFEEEGTDPKSDG
jgi:hypothetical protein